MKAYQLLLAGALLLGPATVSMAQTDTKAVVEQTKQLIQTKGADFDKQVKELYKTNKKNPASDAHSITTRILPMLLSLLIMLWLRTTRMLMPTSSRVILLFPMTTEVPLPRSISRLSTSLRRTRTLIINMP